MSMLRRQFFQLAERSPFVSLAEVFRQALQNGFPLLGY